MIYSVFLDIISGIQDTEEWAQDCAENFRKTKLFEGTYCDVSCDGIPAYKALWNTLISYYTKEDIELIRWWLYENVEKIIYEEDRSIKLKTVKDLYNYLSNS